MNLITSVWRCNYMEVSYKLYPYPVLAFYNDDYVDSSFEINVTESHDRHHILFNFDVQLDNDHLNSLIETDLAEFAVHIECSSTLYRNFIRFNDSSFEFEIPSGQLNGKINLCPYIISKTDIEEYRNPNFNFYFNGMSFSVEKNNTLAVGVQTDIIIEKDYDDLKNVASIFVVTPNFDEDCKEVIYYLNDVITIQVPKKEFDKIKILGIDQKNNELINSLLIGPVLVKIFETVKNREDILEEYGEHKWFRAINRALAKQDIHFESDNFKSLDSINLAQRILESPILKGVSNLFDQKIQGGILDEN